MKKAKEQQLMRLHHGELPPEETRRLERELEHDGELRAVHQRLARSWDDLELPPSELAAGFSANVVAAARKLHGRQSAGGELSWSLAPAWARGGATAALLTGLLLGAAFGRGFEAPGAGNTTALVVSDDMMIVADADADAVPLSLAEVYWLSLEASDGQLAGDDAEVVP